MFGRAFARVRGRPTRPPGPGDNTPVRIAVAYKWAPNPQDASVAPDGTLDWTRARPAISDYDAVAMAVARQLADAAGAEVVGVTVGTPEVGTPFARKAALSRGLDRLLVAADDRLADLDAVATASALARLVTRADADVVLAGEASLDVGAGLVAAAVGAALGRPVLLRVTAVTATPRGLLVEQLTEDGVRVVRCSGSVVLAVSPDAAEPGVPGMRDVLAAGKKPSEEVAFDDLDLRLAAPTVVGAARPEPRPRLRRMIDAADPDAAAAELVAALRERGVLGGVR